MKDMKKEKLKKLTKILLVFSVIIAIALGVVILSHMNYRAKTLNLNNRFIFLVSDSCQNCDEVREEVKAIAENSNLAFVELKYSEPARIPGYVIVYDNTLHIGGIEDIDSLEATLCSITGK